MNWYKRCMKDYASKTAGLSLTERGAYDALLDEYYVGEGPLPKDKQELYRIVRAFERWERAAVDRVLAKFFTSTDAGYTNPRAEEELAKYKKAADIHRANGRRHGTKVVPNSNLKRTEKLEVRNQINTKPKTIGAQTAPFVPPDWIPPKEWNTWLEIRKAKRAKNNPHALEIAVARLDGLRSQGYDPKAVLENCILNGWQGIFPPRTEIRNGAGKSNHLERTNRTLETARDLLASVGPGVDEVRPALPPGDD